MFREVKSRILYEEHILRMLGDLYRVSLGGDDSAYDRSVRVFIIMLPNDVKAEAKRIYDKYMREFERVRAELEERYSKSSSYYRDYQLEHDIRERRISLLDMVVDEIIQLLDRNNLLLRRSDLEFGSPRVKKERGDRGV